MQMRVVEPRDGRSTLGIDDDRARVSKAGKLVAGADRENSAALDRDDLSAGSGAIERQNPGVG